MQFWEELGAPVPLSVGHVHCTRVVFVSAPFPALAQAGGGAVGVWQWNFATWTGGVHRSGGPCRGSSQAGARARISRRGWSATSL